MQSCISPISQSAYSPAAYSPPLIPRSLHSSLLPSGLGQSRPRYLVVIDSLDHRRALSRKRSLRIGDFYNLRLARAIPRNRSLKVAAGVGYARLQKSKARRGNTRQRERRVELLPKGPKRQRLFVFDRLCPKLCLFLSAFGRTPVEDWKRDCYYGENARVMFEGRRPERIGIEAALNEVGNFRQPIRARRNALLFRGSELGGKLRDLGPAGDRRRGVAIELREFGRSNV